MTARNRKRAARVRAYATQYAKDNEDAPLAKSSAVCDMISDLLHLARQLGMHPDTQVARAVENFKAEECPDDIELAAMASAPRGSGWGCNCGTPS